MTTTNQSDYAAFILRISLGSLALAHGLLKVFVFTIPGTVSFFASLGYPAILAYAVIGAEVVGGQTVRRARRTPRRGAHPDAVLARDA